MLVVLEDAGDDLTGGQADALAPIDQSLRRPVAVRPVRGRHVLVDRGEAAAATGAGVAGDTIAAHQQLDAAGGDARLQGLADQRVRRAVAMAVDLDVVVDVQFDGLEAGDLVAARRQRHEYRRVQFGEGTCPAAGQLLERAPVERRQQCRDRGIDLGDGVQALMA